MASMNCILNMQQGKRPELKTPVRLQRQSTL
jgi:hypothetical protein